MAELIVKIAPRIYRYRVIYEKVIPLFYVTLKKSLYVCLSLALLFYKPLVVDTRDKGFDPKPYEPFVANKIIGGKRMMI